MECGIYSPLSFEKWNIQLPAYYKVYVSFESSIGQDPAQYLCNLYINLQALEAPSAKASTMWFRQICTLLNQLDPII